MTAAARQHQAWDTVFRRVAHRRTRGGPKVTSADIMVWTAELNGEAVTVTSTVRCIEPMESFVTNSGMRLRDSHVGTYGHFVDLVVEPAGVAAATLRAVERLASAADSRICLARRKGEPLRRPK